MSERAYRDYVNVRDILHLSSGHNTRLGDVKGYSKEMSSHITSPHT